ncbi:hypothetical protein AKJ41_02425 [candidate division MSBL1 archaeon SCGC-AAA259O05]|uniref:Uncharacterized protein n=1 Tax=candidate division MSBL1 archaeon SCGC-AAA259O05 TaxID=1698271 RepID=A0A133V423_9EURY|nr:hypothetical protein AKJ41_02425 [candidate division MSBL1 archaeon SCGC-AAA259O05]
MKEKLEKASVNIEWFDTQDSKQFRKLLEDFEEVVGEAIEKSMNHDDFKVERSKIEHIFKIAKQVYGVKDLHVYYKEGAYWKIFIGFYSSCMLYQDLNDEKINVNRAVGLFGDNTDVW